MTAHEYFDRLIKWTAHFEDPSIVANLLDHPAVAAWISSFIEPQHINSLNITNKVVKIVVPPLYIDEFVRRRSGLERHRYEWELWVFTTEGIFLCGTSAFTTPGKRGTRGVNSPRQYMNPIITENPQPIASRWLSQQGDSKRFEIGQLAKKCTISIHGTEPGYPYKFVQPHLGIEQVLNRPIAELIGNPIDVVDSVIAEATTWAIERAARTGMTQFVPYRFYWDSPWDWMKRDWKKIVIATPLIGCDEVLVEKVSPEVDFEEDQRLWQRFLFEVR